MKGTINRRKFLKTAAAGSAAAAGPWFIPDLYAADDIKIAGIHDASGGLDIYCTPMINCLTLAVEDINAKGGLLGRKIALKNYDTQSNIQLYTQYATEVATKEHVAAVFGGITSASREAMRPVLDRFKTLYFYNTLYEGGVCDRNIFIVGTTPAQTLEKMIPYVMKKWGKKVYTLAADYIYGQTTAKWVKKYVVENGGEVLNTDFFPLDVTNFGPTIAKIQAAKPDIVMSVLVGGAHISFYRQWAASGMKKQIPMASTTFGIGNEQAVLTPEEGDGIIASYGYFPSIQTPDQSGVCQTVRRTVRQECAGQYRDVGDDLSGRQSVGRSRHQGGHPRPHKGHRGAGNRSVLRRPSGKDDHRSGDASLHHRRLYRRMRKSAVEGAEVVPAAEAGGYGGRLQSDQKPERQSAVHHRRQDLRPMTGKEAEYGSCGHRP